MKKSLQVSLLIGFFIVAITIKAKAGQGLLSDDFLQPFTNTNTTIVEQNYDKAFPIDLQKKVNGFASTLGSTDVIAEPTPSQTVFGGSDPGFGDGGDAGAPPDTPIDGGISLLVVLGIGKGLKSFKNRGNKSKMPGLKTSAG